MTHPSDGLAAPDESNPHESFSSILSPTMPAPPQRTPPPRDCIHCGQVSMLGHEDIAECVRELATRFAGLEARAQAAGATGPDYFLKPREARNGWLK